MFSILLKGQHFEICYSFSGKKLFSQLRFGSQNHYMLKVAFDKTLCLDRWFPFLTNRACCEPCGNLKAAFLVAVVSYLSSIEPLHRYSNFYFWILIYGIFYFSSTCFIIHFLLEVHWQKILLKEHKREFLDLLVTHPASLVNKDFPQASFLNNVLKH